MKLLTLLFFVITLFSCSQDNFPKISTLEDLRIITIIADKPEVSDSGETVAISLWVSDPKGGNRLIDVSYKTCLDPGVNLGIKPDCPGVTPTTINNIALSSPQRTEEISNIFSFIIPSGLLTSFSSNVQFNGINYLVVIEVSSGDEIIKSFKRIRISSKNNPDFNTNPVLTGLTVNDSIPAFPLNKSQVKAITGSAPENFSFYNEDGDLISREEKMTISWFATDAEIFPSVTDADEAGELKIKNNPSQMTIIGVLRDGRGGIAVHKEEFP